MKFLWATIMVKNLEKSLEFYQNIVKLPLKERFMANKDKEIAFLGSGETLVELIEDKADSSTIGSGISLGFQVDSLDQMIEFLADKNIEIASGPFQPNENIKFLYILDPDGLQIQFSQEL